MSDPDWDLTVQCALPDSLVKSTMAPTPTPPYGVPWVWRAQDPQAR